MPGVEMADPFDDGPQTPHDRTVDLDSSGPPLELGDLGGLGEVGEFGSAAPRAPLPPPGSPFDDELDLPAPVGAPGADDLGLDLPAPVGPRGGPFGSGAGDLDLDLPTPVGPRGGPFGAGAGDLDLDLPTPVQDLDLPTPVQDLDLPAPVDDLDLPTPSLDFDLPTPADDSLMPAENLPAPRGGGPALDLDFDLDDSALPELEPDPARPNLVDAREGEGAAKPREREDPGSQGQRAAPARPGASPSPAPVAATRPTVSKPLIYAAAAVLGLGAVGGGLWAAGLLGGADPAQQGQRGGAAKGGTAPVAPGEVAERAAPVLAEFDADTPAGYQRAMALAEQVADRAGQAEAGLLMHLRYGPDPVLLGQARGLLEPLASETAPYVTRVRALAALADGDLAGARATLESLEGAEAPRVALHRAWILGALGEHPAALEAAKAATAGRPGDRAADLALFEARLATGDAAALDEMLAGAETRSDHPAYLVALVDALLDAGRLADADRIAESMPSLGTASEAYQGAALAQKARIAAAQGQRAAALRMLESARSKAPEAIGIAVAHIDVLIDVGDLRAARREAEVLLQSQPEHAEALLAAARTDLATGEGDSALARLDTLAGLRADEPRVPLYRGRVMAIRSKYDEAGAEFQAARAMKPGFTQATVEEAEMIARNGKIAPALALLDEEIAAIETLELAEAERKAALADLYAGKGRLLAGDGRQGEALAALDLSVANDGRDNAVRLLRAQTMLATGDRDGGQAELIALFERTGGFPGLAGPLGRVFLRAKQYERLEGLIGGQLEDPERATEEILLTGARLRVAQEKYAEARSLTDKVLARTPTSWEARLVKGQALLLAGDIESALVEIEQARPREPDPEVELWTGQALEYNGRAKEAASHYKRALELDPRLTQAAALYGRQLAYAGAAKAALAVLDPLVAETEEFPYAFTAQGIARRDLGQADAAVKSFRRASTLDPKDFEAYYWEGRLHGDRNQHRAAAQALAKAVEIGAPGTVYHDDAYRRLGEAYEALGRTEDAKRTYTTYLANAASDAPGREAVQRRLSRL